MSRFIPHGDMTAAQILANSYDMLAILHVVKTVADGAEGASLSADATASISRLMTLAIELHALVHDALEEHEGLKGGAS